MFTHTHPEGQASLGLPPTSPENMSTGGRTWSNMSPKEGGVSAAARAAEDREAHSAALGTTECHRPGHRRG